MPRKNIPLKINSIKIKSLLRDLEKKQIDLAAEIDYAPESVSRFLRLGVIENNHILDKIAKYLDVNPAYLTDEIDVPLPYPTPSELEQTQLKMSDKDIELAFKSFTNASEAYEYMFNTINNTWKTLRQNCPEGENLEEYVKKHLVVKIK